MWPHDCYAGLYISRIVMLEVVPLYAIITVELLTYRLSKSVRYNNIQFWMKLAASADQAW